MNIFDKIKRILLIALGFGLATYLIMSGSAMLSQDYNATTLDQNSTIQGK
ncbi:hypothetical protein [Sulfurimonas sp.]|jgi:hypothetical protein|nr:hypothetical protein [Sulfurimonas sp.]MBT5934744.1 hypothetical protein [Sulfurimonas sp.]